MAKTLQKKKEEKEGIKEFIKLLKAMSEEEQQQLKGIMIGFKLSQQIYSEKMK